MSTRICAISNPKLPESKYKQRNLTFSRITEIAHMILEKFLITINKSARNAIKASCKILLEKLKVVPILNSFAQLN